MLHTYIFIFLVILNIVTFLIYGADKKRARTRQWRIPEKTLLLLALCGGSIGAYAGMHFFRHKTQKPLFKIGIPLIFLCQLALAAKLTLT